MKSSPTNEELTDHPPKNEEGWQQMNRCLDNVRYILQQEQGFDRQLHQDAVGWEWEIRRHEAVLERMDFLGFVKKLQRWNPLISRLK